MKRSHKVNPLIRFYTLLRILSLDVVVGACIGTFFVSEYIKVNISWPAITCLGLAVWIIYTADHLVDAYRLSTTAYTARHVFFQRHFKSLLIWMIIMLLLGVAIAMLLPLRTFWWGLELAMAVVIYFSLLLIFRGNVAYHKEVLGALIYASGVFLAPVSIYPGEISADILALFLQFFIIALVNLLIFSLMELEIDRKHEHQSLVLFLGKNASRQLIIGLLGIFCLSLLLSLLFYQQTGFVIAEIIFAAMMAFLMIIFFSEKHFKKDEWYRILGDLVFVFPVFYP